MSGSDPPDDAQTARAYYDRMLAETRKFSAEQNKLGSAPERRYLRRARRS